MIPREIDLSRWAIADEILFRHPHCGLISPGKEWVVKSSLLHAETTIVDTELGVWRFKQWRSGTRPRHFASKKLNSLYIDHVMTDIGLIAFTLKILFENQALGSEVMTHILWGCQRTQRAILIPIRYSHSRTNTIECSFFWITWFPWLSSCNCRNFSEKTSCKIGIFWWQFQ
jgi:hypothetical protein